MPRLVYDPLHDRTVLIATERQARPLTTAMQQPSLAQQMAQSAISPLDDCPFCPGQEHRTTPELLAIHAVDSQPNQAGWQARLIPNLYPAVTDEPIASNKSADSLHARGSHEVLVCAPEHYLCSSQLSTTQAEQTWLLLQQRSLQHRAAGQWRWTSLFQNVGAAAGASLSHLHCQLLALPQVPTALQAEFASGQRYYEEQGTCAWCAEIMSARAEQTRWVTESKQFVAFCPRAPRLPYETWILPKRHHSHFELTAQADLADLAKLWGQVLRALGAEIPAYNWWIHSSPFDSEPKNHYHWHIEILPRFTTTAGFEWSTGWFINTHSAEAAAQQLRQTLQRV